MTPLCKYDTGVTLDIIFDQLWLPLKGISMAKTYIEKLSNTISINFTHKIWGLNKDLFYYNCDFVVYFLREFEAIFKKGFNPCIRGL
jgi:hypothetical protein